MQSLWALLRPQPGGKNSALAAMTLLGKLGGRNRRWLQTPVPLEYKKDPEHGLRWGRGRTAARTALRTAARTARWTGAPSSRWRAPGLPLSRTRTELKTCLGDCVNNQGAGASTAHRTPRSHPSPAPPRLVVTFHPDTQHAGFLVPIDRCVALAKAGIYAPPGGLASGNGVAGAAAADKAHEAHYKEQVRGAGGGGKLGS
jgi:hypothetical protein